MSEDDKKVLFVNKPSFQLRIEREGIYFVNPAGEAVDVKDVVHAIQEVAGAMALLGATLQPLAEPTEAEEPKAEAEIPPDLEMRL